MPFLTKFDHLFFVRRVSYHFRVYRNAKNPPAFDFSVIQRKYVENSFFLQNHNWLNNSENVIIVKFSKFMFNLFTF